MIFIIIICFVLMVLFIIWQFKVLAKYSFNYDKFSLDIPHRQITIKGKTFHFKDIDYITVEKLEQPSSAEKLLTKSGCYSFMSQISYHLKNGSTETCKLNAKGTLYSVLKALKPYVRIEADIDEFKIKFTDLLPLIILIGCIIYLFSNNFLHF